MLVFPGAAFKGLGAMFGHTLIRFDAQNKQPLISYSVSYSALSGGDNLLAYIWKGLTGGFNGYYSLAAYYQKMHEYRDMEERDVWEYPLTLDPGEVNMMVLHAIELQNIASRYYFLDENCALNLLFLIEAGRPSLQLVEHYWQQSEFWVIPSDTVMYLWREGVLKNPHFERSLSSQIDFYSHYYRQPVIAEALHLADRNNSNTVAASPALSRAEQQAARELAAKIVQYRFSKLQLPQEVFSDKYNALAKGNESILSKELPLPPPPHEGHPAQRLTAASGFLASRPFIELGWRPAYHDWNDPPAGYPDQGTLNFLDLTTRYYSAQNAFELQHFSLIQAGSLSPENAVTKQMAWSFGSGLAQTYLPDDDRHLLYYLDGGAGKSYRVKSSCLVYWLVKGSLLAGSGLSASVDLGPEFEVGFSRSLGSRWQMHLSATAAYYGISSDGFLEDAKFSLTRLISNRNAVSLQAGVSGAGWQHGLPEVLIRWQHYF